MMRTSAVGRELMIHFEGLHDGDLQEIGLQPKLCPAGIWTVGYGHAVVDPATGKQLTVAGGQKAKARAAQLFGSMTVEDAEDLFAADLERFEKEVSKLVKIPLMQHEFDALVSWHFNTGGLRKTSGLAKLNAGDKLGAWSHFGAWNKITSKGPAPVPGLVRRRNAERALFFGQVWRSATL